MKRPSRYTKEEITLWVLFVLSLIIAAIRLAALFAEIAAR